MLKFVVVLVALIGIAVADNNKIDIKTYEQRAYEIAQWAAIKMPLYTGVDATHYAIQVKNVKTQMQDGIKFDFDVDYSIATGENGQQIFKTCTLSVMDIPWTNVRYLFNEVNPSSPKPTCVDSKLNF
jgi:hypothetical protein